MIKSKLKDGDMYYTAYVGPPDQYDFMGATQFRLLCALGLREKHCVLDFGCGSLRTGRLLIPYLARGNYFGIEPNKWLIDEAIENQLGNDIIRIKKPKFSYNDDFATDVFSQRFDFIVAQSIFSHTGPELIIKALRNFENSIKDEGKIIVTFIEGTSDYNGHGWIYPKCVTYNLPTIKSFANVTNLNIARLPWYHPRQTWYLLSKRARALPNSELLNQLTGIVLFEEEFGDSCRNLINR